MIFNTVPGDFFLLIFDLSCFVWFIGYYILMDKEDTLTMKVYLVGGAVRDRLLNIPVYDRDWVVVGATADEMLAKGYQQVGKDFPVFLHPKSKEEYALARTEKKQGVGYHGFEVCFEPTVSLEEDLIRRDLTINAIAEDTDGNLIDPYAGQADLEQKLLRHVSLAFSEDPLRVLRVARFAARFHSHGFTIADETLVLMSQMVASGELENLTPERVWQEVVKALKTQTPSVFFKVLRQVGAIEVLFPELHQLIDVEQPKIHHPEGDVWIHSLMVLDASVLLSDDVSVRFSALVHDFGKGLTPKEYYPRHHGHEAAGVALVTAFCQRYRVSNELRNLAEKATEFHGLIHQALDKDGYPHFKPATYLKILTACLALKNQAFFENILTVCESDIKGRLGFEDKAYPQRQFWQKLAQACKQVDNQKILETGVKGAAVGVAIDKQRLVNIKAVLMEFDNV